MFGIWPDAVKAIKSAMLYQLSYRPIWDTARAAGLSRRLDSSSLARVDGRSQSRESRGDIRA